MIIIGSGGQGLMKVQYSNAYDIWHNSLRAFPFEYAKKKKKVF